MSKIVIDRVSHVVRSKEIFEAVLVDNLVFEHFDKNV